VYYVQFKLYASEYPRDGQDGLGAMVDAFRSGVFTLLGVFVVVFLLQRAFARR